MLNQTLPADLPATIQLTGFICQICTTLIAAVIGLVTFRYTRRQNALTLINQNNSLANLVNSTILQSEQAQQTLGKLHSFVVGCPDDAILFMYLNYVHNTFRTHQIGAVSAHVWRDTLASCVTMMGRLRRDQLEGPYPAGMSLRSRGRCWPARSSRAPDRRGRHPSSRGRARRRRTARCRRSAAAAPSSGHGRCSPRP